MKKKKHKREDEKPDAFDIASKGKKEKPDLMNEPVAPEPRVDDDSEEVSEAEANAMIERAEKRKTDEKKKAESVVDQQDWSKDEPVIPEDLKGGVWVAVYRCPAGHKTKATNRQAESGVTCHICKEKADVMPQFLDKPEPPADDIEKRKQAAKGKA